MVESMELLTPSQVCKLLKVSESTFFRLVRRNAFGDSNRQVAPRQGNGFGELSAKDGVLISPARVTVLGAGTVPELHGQWRYFAARREDGPGDGGQQRPVEGPDVEDVHAGWELDNSPGAILNTFF